MKRKNQLFRILTTISIFFILVFINTLTYCAGSFSVSSSSNNINIGTTITISVAANNCTGRFDISSSDSSKLSIEGASSNWAENNTITFTAKAKSSGNVTITVTPSSVADSDSGETISGSKTINITIKEPTSNNTNTNSNTNSNTTNNTNNNTTNNTTKPPVNNNQTTTVTKSSVNTLTGISPSIGELTPKFNKHTTEYTLNVASNVNIVDFSVIKDDTKSNYIITGNDDLKAGENKATITVVAENGSQRVYTINIIKEENIIDLKLSTLEIEGFILTPTFSPDIYEYTLDLTEDISKLNITATGDPLFTIEIIGNEELQEGENIISILVKLNDETTEISQKEYKIKVNKTLETSPIEENTHYDDTLSSFIKNNKMYLLISLGVAFLVIVIIIIVTTIIKNKKTNTAEVDDVGVGDSDAPTPEPTDELEPEIKKKAKHF